MGFNYTKSGVDSSQKNEEQDLFAVVCQHHHIEAINSSIDEEREIEVAADVFTQTVDKTPREPVDTCIPRIDDVQIFADIQQLIKFVKITEQIDQLNLARKQSDCDKKKIFDTTSIFKDEICGRQFVSIEHNVPDQNRHENCMNVTQEQNKPVGFQEVESVDSKH